MNFRPEYFMDIENETFYINLYYKDPSPIDFIPVHLDIGDIQCCQEGSNEEKTKSEKTSHITTSGLGKEEFQATQEDRTSIPRRPGDV